eukprot:gene11903-5309_t
MIEPSRFFLEEENTSLFQSFSEFQKIKYDSNGCSITGNKKSAISTLLFQYSYSLSLEAKNVLYICQKSKIQANPPLISRDQLDEESLSNIKIKYIENDLELRKYLSQLHLSPVIYDCYIIDNLSGFFTKETPVLLVKTIALLKNIVQWIFKTKGKECLYLISDNDEHTLPFYERWMNMSIHVRPYENQEYYFSITDINGSKDESKTKCLYSISSEKITLRKVDFNEN